VSDATPATASAKATAGGRVLARGTGPVAATGGSLARPPGTAPAPADHGSRRRMRLRSHRSRLRSRRLRDARCRRASRRRQTAAGSGLLVRPHTEGQVRKQAMLLAF